MSKQTVSLGTPPSGSGGDTPRSAFTKMQANTDELYAALGGAGSPVALPGALPVGNGGTGASTVEQALSNLNGLANGKINNTPGTSFASGAPPGIANISSTGNDRLTSLLISNAGNTSASAVMTFIREGAFGVHLGIDADNRVKIGGWSMGAVARAIYHEGNVVGPVGQNGGVPTGSVIESGNNSNGSWTRFADGTMICSGNSSSALGCTASFATGLFYSGAWNFTFPVAFTTVPRLTHSAVTANNYFCWTAGEGSLTPTAVSVRAVSGAPNATCYFSYIAIGRWF